MFGRPEVSTQQLFVEITSLLTVILVLSTIVLR